MSFILKSSSYLRAIQNTHECHLMQLSFPHSFKNQICKVECAQLEFKYTQKTREGGSIFVFLFKSLCFLHVFN